MKQNQNEMSYSEIAQKQLWEYVNNFFRQEMDKHIVEIAKKMAREQ